MLMIALAIGVANIGIFIYGFTLPRMWSVRESTVINAEPEEIFPLLSDPHRWADWSIWSKDEDASLSLSYEEETSSEETPGAGTAFEWSGEMLGSGKLTFTDSVPNRSVSYELELQGERFSDKGMIVLEPVSAGTRVTWTDGGTLEGTLQRLFRTRLETAVSSDLSRCLQKLKRFVETSGSESLKQRSIE